MVDVGLSPRAVRAIAESGYVFLFPLVANYGSMYAEAVDRSSPSFGGGFGRWTHRHHALSYRSDVSTRHLTTLSSSAWLDVRAEPWVLWIPPDGCVRTTLVTDLWGFVVDEEESDGPVTHLVVAGDEWAGALPADASQVVRVESQFARCETWGRVPEPVEHASIRDMQGSYELLPLSTLAGGPPAPPAPAPAWWPIDASTLSSMAFWSAATFALSLTTTNDDDRGILDRLAEIGIAPGARWDEHDMPTDVVAAIGEGMSVALTELMRAASRAADDAPTRQSRSGTDRDDFSRALAALRTLPLVDPPGVPASHG